MNDDKKPQNQPNQSDQPQSVQNTDGGLSSKQPSAIPPFPNTDIASSDFKTPADTLETPKEPTVSPDTSAEADAPSAAAASMPHSSPTKPSSGQTSPPLSRLVPDPSSDLSMPTPSSSAPSEEPETNLGMPSQNESAILQEPLVNQPQPESSSPMESSPAIAVPPVPPAPPADNQNMGEVESPPPPIEESSGPNKAILFLIPLVVFLLAALGYFAYTYLGPQSSAGNQPVVPTQAPPTPTPTPTYEEEAAQQIEEMQDVSVSDEIEVLEKDIDAADFATIDADLSVLESEL